MKPGKTIIHYVLAYLLWAVSIALGALALYLLREVVISAMVVSTSQADMTKSEAFYRSLQVGAFTNWSFVVLGILWIAMIVIIEHVYRTGVPIGHLWPRFFLVTGIELVVFCVSHITNIILQSSFRTVSLAVTAIPVVEAVLAALFLWLWHNRQKPIDVMRIV